MSALSSADEVAKSTAPLFRLGRVTAIPVFDDPDRNLLILYLAGPGELSGNASKTGAAVGSEAVADQGRRAAQSAATQAPGVATGIQIALDFTTSYLSLRRRKGLSK
jgi:hypothetical protein